MITDYVFEDTLCLYDYFPSNTSRQVRRFTMKEGEAVRIIADYFIENNWSIFPFFYVDPSIRNSDTINHFISTFYAQPGLPRNSFWWATPKVLEQYLDAIANEHPEMTFAASGEINKVIRPTTSH